MATRILLKSQFAFFQSLSQLFLPTYFVKCRRTLLKLNSNGPYPSSEREVKFFCCLFTFSIKCGISAFSRRSRAVTTKKYTKKHDAHAKVLFPLLNLLFFLTFLLRSLHWILKSLICEETIIFTFCISACMLIAWENSRHLATLPLVSPPNDIWKNKRRNSILITGHYPDLGSASDCLNQIFHAA